jgi:hypothetical protein
MVGQATAARRRWITPGFSLLLFVGYCVLVGIPILALAFGALAAKSTGILVVVLAGGILLIGAGAVALELILVMFHMSDTLEDCREFLKAIATRRE